MNKLNITDVIHYSNIKCKTCYNIKNEILMCNTTHHLFLQNQSNCLTNEGKWHDSFLKEATLQCKCVIVCEQIKMEMALKKG